MNLDQIIARHFRQKKVKEEAETEIDPVTLSRGLVLDRLGPGKDKWGRDVILVLVRVLKKNEHHHKDDEVIWEIPTKDELKKVKSYGGVLSRNDLLRAWLNSPGPGSI